MPFVALLLCSCTSLPKVADAENAGFVLQRYQTDTFLLTAYQKLPAQRADEVHVYIEGDGNSWRSKYRLSDNPTPRHPLGLQLAINDPSPDSVGVVYLARPCQYTPLENDPLCHPRFWSSHRYAPQVINAFDQVLDQIKQAHPQTKFVLTGFSGGASVAALLAARRPDICVLITVAGDLNHERLNQYHQTTPLHGSLNPTAVIPQLSDLSQHHWIGDRDKIVPVFIAQEFVQAVNQNTNKKATVHVLKGVGHHAGWKERWPDLLAQSLNNPAK